MVPKLVSHPAKMKAAKTEAALRNGVRTHGNSCFSKVKSTMVPMMEIGCRHISGIGLKELGCKIVCTISATRVANMPQPICKELLAYPYQPLDRPANTSSLLISTPIS